MSYAAFRDSVTVQAARGHAVCSLCKGTALVPVTCQDVTPGGLVYSVRCTPCQRTVAQGPRTPSPTPPQKGPA